MKFICFGEILFDIINDKERLGGAPLNVAAHLVQLGNKGVIVSAVGNDERGEKAIKEISKLGVSTKLVKKVEQPTGIAIVSPLPGDNSYEFSFPCAWDAIEISLKDLPRETDLMYFGTLSCRSHKSRESLRELLNYVDAQEVFFDVNLRKKFYDRELIQEGVRKATILKVNEFELSVILNICDIKEKNNKDNIIRLSNEYSLKIVIITLGEKGSIAYSGGEWFQVVPHAKSAVDTVGAGDSFSAGFLSSYMKTKKILKALEVGTMIADFVVGHEGAIPLYDETLRVKIQD